MNTIIAKENLHIGNKSKFYTAKARYNNVNFSITYDCNTGDVTIHEWYKFSDNQITAVTAELKKYFKDKAA